MSDAENCSYEDYSSAYKTIFEHLGFNKTDVLTTDIRPVSWSVITNVFVGLYVTSIIDVNEKAQSLTTQVKMITVWYNDLSWWFEDYCGIKTIPVKKSMLWTPDILIKESIKTDFGTKESPYVQINFWGLCISVDILSLTTACKMDLYRFPFDTQICNITLHSAVYTNEELKINPISDNTSLLQDSKDLFQAQGEWELVSINVYEYTSGLLWSSQELLAHQITIKRRPLLYVMNIILPVFVFLVLDVMSFFIDASGADKLSFKVTLLLSVSVLLLILNDTLPSTADKIPLIGIYCSAIFSIIGISILETILVNLLKAKGGEKRAVETTAVERDTNVGDQQSPPDSVGDQHGMQRSLCWIRVARIIDVTFLVLYIITVITFLSVLARIWYQS
ncbi:5-hydroxytryptamine receptor 3A-like [Puntigrus tetrazona]|uniref:5-hydroxytryptamine receptor 3A-like n=1 Tax=Puntigrus tetrazona TaxID=1606681 RepID=UPI001C8A8B08|nr:5-hydroxytryptamine receptor 3A-like [Puntigrus tetrazona]